MEQKRNGTKYSCTKFPRFPRIMDKMHKTQTLDQDCSRTQTLDFFSNLGLVQVVSTLSLGILRSAQGFLKVLSETMHVEVSCFFPCWQCF